MTPSEALQFLRDSLPADRGLDGERDTAIRTLCDKFDSEVQSWIGMYLQAQKRFEGLAMGVWSKVTEGAPLVELVDLAGDWMDDCIDDESLAAFNKAHDAAAERDQAQADAVLLLSRMATDSGERTSLQDVIAELGFTQAEIDAAGPVGTVEDE